MRSPFGRWMRQLPGWLERVPMREEFCDERRLDLLVSEPA
jgi:hypothetical protein